MSTVKGWPPAALRYSDDRPYELEMAPPLPRLDIAYETWGRLSATRDNAVLICPAFSAHCHAASSEKDPAPGWWEGMIGPGAVFDTDHFFVICPSLIGGSFGTTGPLSIDPTTGAPYRGRFPIITVRDIVGGHIRLLDHLGIDQVHTAAGGSLGAMETVELAIRHPGRARRIIAASGTDATRPYTAAIRHLGRRAITLDPAWQGGEYETSGPRDGLRLARELGTLFYRSQGEFNKRFPWTPIHPPSRNGITFDVQSYLDHQGKKAADRFDANSYLTLSLAMDLHDVWRGHADKATALAPVDAEFLVIGVNQDRLIAVDEQEGTHLQLVEAGKTSTYRVIDSPIGHDAFLVEFDTMSEIIRPFLYG
ncbi:MAG: homoserine O-acetyltransferase [Acidobacteriota bacterium]